VNEALDTVCVVLCDTIGGIELCDTTIVIIETPANLPPDAVDDVAFTGEGVPVVIPITTNDDDPDGKIDSSTVMLIDTTMNGGVEIDPVT
jgi:hypothetical protein